MGIKVLATKYEHIKVISTRLNTSIKKAQGNGTYPGTQLNYENMEGELDSAKWAQSWLDNKYQAKLKETIAALEVGDEVTLYWEKTVDESKYNEMEDGSDEKKKAGNWGVKSITTGHVEIPEQTQKTSAAKKATTLKPITIMVPKSSKEKSKPSDKDIGMKVGHALKGATTLCSRLKIPMLDAAKEVYQVTSDLTKDYMQATGLDEWTAGQTVGNAVLNACFLVPKNGSIKEAAKKLLDEYIPAITTYVVEQETPPPAEEESSATPVDEEEQPDGGDDLPW